MNLIGITGNSNQQSQLSQVNFNNTMGNFSQNGSLNSLKFGSRLQLNGPPSSMSISNNGKSTAQAGSRVKIRKIKQEQSDSIFFGLNCFSTVKDSRASLMSHYSSMKIPKTSQQVSRKTLEISKSPIFLT